MRSNTGLTFSQLEVPKRFQRRFANLPMLQHGPVPVGFVLIPACRSATCARPDQPSAHHARGEPGNRPSLLALRLRLELAGASRLGREPRETGGSVDRGRLACPLRHRSSGSALRMECPPKASCSDHGLNESACGGQSGSQPGAHDGGCEIAHRAISRCNAFYKASNWSCLVSTDKVVGKAVGLDGVLRALA